MPLIPDVSVVIPTLCRPALVTRAVHSALAQTVKNIEVIVVIDGPDEETRAVLAGITDPRLRVIALPERGGAPNARNAGVNEARAQWTALLDDDDEWLPRKLEVQLGIGRAAKAPMPVIACRLVNRTPRAEFFMPRLMPTPDEPISEYLTVRHGLFHGDGFIQTSTIMAPTELLRRVPFAVGLRRLHEFDWTLRALAHDDVELVYAAEALVVWHTDEDRPRISFDSSWEQQLAWLRAARPLLTPKAYAAVVMSVISSMAAPSRSPRVFWTLFREAQRSGRPSALDYLTFLQVWFVPSRLRRVVRDRILRRRRGAVPTPPSVIPAQRSTEPTPSEPPSGSERLPDAAESRS